jgi:hypothetical protein
MIVPTEAHLAATAEELIGFVNMTEANTEGEDSGGSSGQASSSLVWVILFSILILASVVLNTVFLAAVVISRRWSPVNVFVILFFTVNLLDYALLLFEFSLGPSLQFAYSEPACALYQLLLQAAPLLTAGLFILLLLSSLPSAPSAPSATLRRLAPVPCLALLLSLPSLAFSGLALYPSGARHCVLDLGGLGASLGLPAASLQLPTALYYLLLRALLPLWLPLLLLPLVRRAAPKPGAGLSLPGTLASSHAVFLLPLTLALTARCSRRPPVQQTHPVGQ